MAEVESGHAGGGFLKYKLRNVVVERDFPRDCGRFAERKYGVSKEGDGSSKVGEENGTIVKPESVKDSGVFGGSQAAESLDGSVQAESETSKASTFETAKLLDTSGHMETLHTVKAVEQETSGCLSQAMDSETTKPLQTSSQVEELETMKAVEHETSAHKSQAMDSEAALETSDQVEEIETVKPLEHETSKQTLNSETVKPLATLDQMEVPGPIQNVEAVATVLPEQSGQIELPEVSKSLEPQNTSDIGLVPSGRSVPPEALDVSKVSDQPQLAVPNVEATVVSRLPVTIPQIRASVVRDFPPGCGRNTDAMSREEYLKAIDALKDTIADRGRLTGEHRPNDAGLIPQRRASAVRHFPAGCGRNADALSREEYLKAIDPLKDTSADRGRLTGEHRPNDAGLIPQTRASAVRHFPAGCGRNADALSREEYLKAIDPLRDTSADRGRLTGEHRPNDAGLIPQIRASAVRQFPAGCGRNADALSREDYLKAKDQCVKLKSNVTEETEDMVRRESREITSDIKFKQKVRQTSLFRLYANSQSVTAITEVGIPNRKLGKEVKHSKEKSSKRPFHAVSQCHGTEIFSLEPADKKVIVQALTAAPYCPWRQGRSAIKSSSTICPATNKAEKHEFMAQDKSASISKKKRDEFPNSSGEYKKKKLLPTEMGSYRGLGQLLLREEDNTVGHDEEDENVTLDKKPEDCEVSLNPLVLHISRGKGDGAKVTREKVRETLRVFQVIFRKILQGEEAHSKDQGKSIRRIDLQAASVLKEANKWVNTQKILGSVPGVEVGDEFHYRVELAIVGLHGPYQSGIDYIKKDGEVLATSVIASGGYPDDMDSSDVLIYSGQGGKPMGGGKQKQAEDQKLERGNLALKNSMAAGNVVRVTRGFREMNSSDSVDSKGKTTTIYTYDGLYVVEDYWTESSHYGTSVFKFKLTRIPGQPELAWKEVKRSRKSKVREGLCVVDISQEKEKIPIGAVNTIDDEKPQPFTYITKMIYPDWYNPIPPKGCDCTNGCLDSKICSCAVKNRGDFPFNFDRAIVQAKPLVYECGPSCRCPPSCHNRVSQHGIKFQLEIFKTESRGWGVRSLTSIPSGSFVCEYTGQLLQDKEAEQRTGNDEYLFDIGHNYNDHTLCEGLPNVIPDLQPSSPCEVFEDACYTIDAAQYGSVGRFINHSCSPNLYAQNVLYDHDDKRMPHIMLFAAENIPPLKELTYHYNYMMGQVHDAEGNVKEKRCYCGSAECSGRLY